MRFLFLILLLCLAPPAMAQDYWRISTDDFACIQANLAAYESSEDDPVIIVTRACPVVDRQKAIARLQSNSALPQIRETERGKVDEYIFFNRSELACLKNQDFPTEAEAVLVPRAPCDR